MHQIQLEDPQRLIDSTSLVDFVDLFFAGKPSKFKVQVVPTWEVAKGEDRNLRGLHRYLYGQHEIKLFAREIDNCVAGKKPCGGNRTVPRSLREGIYFTFVHELRHAYQHVMHGTGSSYDKTFFMKGKYLGRASEVDARRHVDENRLAIQDFIG